MESFPPSSSSSSSTSSLSSSSSSESDSDLDQEDFNQDEQVSNEPPLTAQAAKARYRKMKSQLLDSIRSNEMLKEELRRHQTLLLKINQDKYFLFERLLAHEKPPPKTAAKKPSDGQPSDGVKVPKKRGPKPKKKLQDERLPPSSSSADEKMLLSSPVVQANASKAGQSLLKLKLSSGLSPVKALSEPKKRNPYPKSEAVFRTPGKKNPKRKSDFSEDSSSNDADLLFREAASKTTEFVPDQLFDDVR